MRYNTLEVNFIIVLELPELFTIIINSLPPLRKDRKDIDIDKGFGSITH